MAAAAAAAAAAATLAPPPDCVGRVFFGRRVSGSGGLWRRWCFAVCSGSARRPVLRGRGVRRARCHRGYGRQRLHLRCPGVVERGRRSHHRSHRNPRSGTAIGRRRWKLRGQRRRADTEESNPYRDTSSASASLPVLILMAVILACVGGGAVWVSVKGGGCIKEEDIVDASCDDSDSDDGVGDNVIIDFRRRDGSSGGGSGGGGIGRGEETGVELADFGAPHRKKESAVTSSSRSRPAYQTVDTRGSSEEKKMSVSNPMQAGRSTTPTNDPPDGAAAAEEEDDSRWL